MYGTLLDQRVFESLVEKTMPIIWDHLVKNDVQLSVVSLPWFLSLYINSMPLIFAFRVLDVFFLEGPRVLFQVGLAILRINGEELLDATDGRVVRVDAAVDDGDADAGAGATAPCPLGRDVVEAINRLDILERIRHECGAPGGTNR